MDKADKNWYGYYVAEKEKNIKLQAEIKKLKGALKKIVQEEYSLMEICNSSNKDVVLIVAEQALKGE